MSSNGFLSINQLDAQGIWKLDSRIKSRLAPVASLGDLVSREPPALHHSTLTAPGYLRVEAHKATKVRMLLAEPLAAPLHLRLPVHARLGHQSDQSALTTARAQSYRVADKGGGALRVTRTTWSRLLR